MGVKRPFEATIDDIRFFVDNESKRVDMSERLRHYYQAWPLKDVVLDGENGVFKLEYGSRVLSFQYTRRTKTQFLFILKEFFLKEPYGELDVNGKDVLDIGANIGDSAIYFCCRGAKRVIALEPYPYFFRIAEGNIAANNLQDRVVLLNEGAGRRGSVVVDVDKELPPWSGLEASSHGSEIKTCGLREMIEQFHLDRAVLKVNCEGCEYELFSTATDEDLSRFSQIMLEYHHGSEMITNRLKASGFTIRKWNVRSKYDPNAKAPGDALSEEGFILAKSGRNAR